MNTIAIQWNTVHPHVQAENRCHEYQQCVCHGVATLAFVCPCILFSELLGCEVNGSVRLVCRDACVSSSSVSVCYSAHGRLTALCPSNTTRQSHWRLQEQAPLWLQAEKGIMASSGLRISRTRNRTPTKHACTPIHQTSRHQVTGSASTNCAHDSFGGRGTHATCTPHSCLLSRHSYPVAANSCWGRTSCSPGRSRKCFHPQLFTI
jgi:hypothetical protein